MRLLACILILSLIPARWETDFETARAVAREKDRLILLNFSGSDWCAPCIATKKDYFQNEAFLSMAGQNLVLLNADFPRRKKNLLPPEQAKKNDALAERYNREGNFPLTLLLNADGNVLRTWKGRPEKSVEKWTEEIREACSSHKK